MTDHTNRPAGVSVPVRIDRTAAIIAGLERVLVAAQAARRAIDVAIDLEQTTRAAQLAPRDIFRNWQSANLLAQSTLDRLYGDVLDVDMLLRAIQPH